MNNSNKRWFGKTRINNTIQNNKCHKSLNMYKLRYHYWFAPVNLCRRCFNTEVLA